MSHAQSRIQRLRDWVHDNRRPLFVVFAAIAAAILFIGLTLSWFVNSKSLSTVGKVQAPATLKVLGPNQTAIEQIDLTNDVETDTNSNNTITRKRAFCVESNGAAFELQVANTTNIDGLDIKVYRVSNTAATTSNADVAGFDGLNHPYAWQKGDEVTGFNFINQDQATGIAVVPGTGQSDPVYDSYADVQKNARALYRYKRFTQDDLDQGSTATNFILECTWDASKYRNVKETDVVYLIARTYSAQ